MAPQLIDQEIVHVRQEARKNVAHLKYHAAAFALLTDQQKELLAQYQTKLLFDTINNLPQWSGPNAIRTDPNPQEFEKKVQASVDAVTFYIKRCLDCLPVHRGALMGMLVPSEAQIFVIGDVHSSFDVLLAQIEKMRSLGCFFDNSLKLHEQYYLIFLGDFADRGENSQPRGTETLLLAMGLKLINRDNVFICRGNHELKSVSEDYGFFKNPPNNENTAELLTRFGSTHFDNVRDTFNSLFEKLPLAIFLGARDTLTKTVYVGMFNHAGLDDKYIAIIKNLLQDLCQGGEKELKTVYTKSSIHESGLVWGDYKQGIDEKPMPSTRGVPADINYTFNGAKKYLKDLAGKNYTVAFQARGHQHDPGATQFVACPNKDDKCFKPLSSNAAITIEEPEIFSFLCSRLKGDRTSFGMGRFKIKDRHWVMTAYVMTNQNAKYKRCNRNNEYSQ